MFAEFKDASLLDHNVINFERLYLSHICSFLWSPHLMNQCGACDVFTASINNSFIFVTSVFTQVPVANI